MVPVCGDQNILGAPLGEGRIQCRLYLIFKLCAFKFPQKFSQTGAMVPDVVMVFNYHLPNEVDLSAGNQVVNNTILRSFYVEFQEVNWPLNKL